MIHNAGDIEAYILPVIFLSCHVTANELVQKMDDDNRQMPERFAS
jgi:hypothetical protein